MKKYLINLCIPVFFLAISARAQWTDNTESPLAISAVAGSQTNPVIIYDADLGSYIFWTDGRGARTAIYGQHLDKDGNSLWEANGKAIIEYTDADASKVMAVFNKEGNILIGWLHTSSGYADTLYAQKLSLAGEAVWPNPVAVAGNDLSTGGSFWGPVNFTMLSDEDTCYFAVQTTGYGYDFLLINRLENDGNLPWEYNGMIFSGFTSGGNLKLLPAEDGNFFISWDYYKSYLQKFSFEGEILWPAAVAVNTCTDGAGGTYAGFPYFLIAPDGAGGIMSAWSSYSDDIYAARTDSEGAFVWDDPCSSIYTDAYSQEEIAFSKAGDAYYVSWLDSRPEDPGIYMQKFNNAGETGWPEALYVEDTGLYVPVLKSIATSEGDIVLFYQAASAFFAHKVHPDGTTEWAQPLKMLGYGLAPYYQNYNLIATEDGNIIGVAESGNAGDQNIYAFNINYISGDTITEDTSSTQIIAAAEKMLTLYPNPVENICHVSVHNGAGAEGALINTRGIVIQSNILIIPGEDYMLDMSAIPPGIYFLKIQTGKEIFFWKIIKV